MAGLAALSVPAALPVSAGAKIRASTRSFAFDGDAAATGWIDFNFFQDTQIHLNGTLQGHEVGILIDSGVSGLIVDQSLAKKLRLSERGAVPLEAVAAKVSGAILEPVPLRVGNLEITSATAFAVDLSPVYRVSGQRFDVILGRDLFEQLVVEIDFAGRRLSAGEPAVSIQARAASIPLKRVGRLRALPTMIEGRGPVLAAFDLGSGAPLLISPRFAGRKGLVTGRRVSTAPSTGVDGTTITTVLTLSDVELGGFKFPQVPAKVLAGWTHQAGIEAVVGVGLLKRFRLVIDYPRDRLWADAAPEAFSKPFEKNRAGLHTVPAPDRLKVIHVSKGSPAEAAGWREGEEIMAVKGRPITASYATDKSSRWAEGEAGTAVEFALTNGRTRKLILGDYY